MSRWSLRTIKSLDSPFFSPKHPHVRWKVPKQINFNVRYINNTSFKGSTYSSLLKCLTILFEHFVELIWNSWCRSSYIPLHENSSFSVHFSGNQISITYCRQIVEETILVKHPVCIIFHRRTTDVILAPLYNVVDFSNLRELIYRGIKQLFSIHYIV